MTALRPPQRIQPQTTPNKPSAEGARREFRRWSLVDDDTALIGGREVGVPKKMGEFEWAFDGDRFSTAVSRRGGELVRMEGTLGASAPEAPPVFQHSTRGLIGTALPFILPVIIANKPTEQRLEARAVDLKLAVQGSERDPIDQLIAGDPLDAYYHRINLGGWRSIPPIPVQRALPWEMLRLGGHRIA
jgi:acetoacetate decarboxylase